MNPRNTDEHHIHVKKSKHHLKNFKVALKCSEVSSEFTIVDQADTQEKKVVTKLKLETLRNEKLRSEVFKNKGMEPAKNETGNAHPEAAEHILPGVCSKLEKTIQKRKHSKQEEHTSIRKQKRRPDVKSTHPEILPNSQDSEPLYTEDQNTYNDGPQNESNEILNSEIVKESVSCIVLNSLQSLCRQINPFVKTDTPQTISASSSHEVPKVLQPELQLECDNSSDYQDAEDNLSPSELMSSAAGVKITVESKHVENQQSLPVNFKLTDSTRKDSNQAQLNLNPIVRARCDSLKIQEVSVSLTNSTLVQSSNDHTILLTSDSHLSCIDTSDKLVMQEKSSIEVDIEIPKAMKEVPFVPLTPPKPSEFGLKHHEGPSHKVSLYMPPLAVQTKSTYSSPDDASSSSAVTVMPAVSRLSPQTRHSTTRSDLSTFRHFSYLSTTSSPHGNKPKKAIKYLKLKKARKPEPYRRAQSKYKIHPRNGKRKSKKEIPYMVNRFLKSNEVSGRVEDTLKAAVAKSSSWQQYRNFMRPPSARGLEFAKDPFQYHTPDVISSQQLLSYASYPVPPHLIGFKNFGNTCYMNATLQALTGLTKFCVGMSSLQTGPNMVGYLKQLLSVHHEGNDPTSALKAFREYFITEVFPQFDNCNQQDASEFLITLINQGIKETNLFHDFFQFKYIEEIKCKKCVKVTCSTVQKDVMLNLMMPKQEFGIASVQALMRNQLTTCQICKSENALCSYKFITLPRVLVLVMQRYCHTRTNVNDSQQIVKKIKTPFNLSHTLQVQHLVQSPEIFCSQTSVTGAQNTFAVVESKSQPLIREFEASHVLQYYHLSAVVCHIGDGTNVGHYLADVYRSNMDGWFHYNDEAVSCTTFDHTELKENCYLLFYSLNK